jgi:rod shape-determining protein MreC
VYDKTVRRRRAVLALLVALSLILLTASFGNPASGGLHAVQRGFLTILSPIENGASQAVKPVRDLFSWISDTIAAKGQVGKLRKDVQALQAQIVAEGAAARTGSQAMAAIGLDRAAGLDAYGPVSASVNVNNSQNLFNQAVGVNKGTSSGVAVGDPVITGDGLVGKVIDATSNQSFVRLISDTSSGVSATDNTTSATGIVGPTPGDPGNLTLQFLGTGDTVKPGDVIVTSGAVTAPAGGTVPSLFPPNIPIGRVTSVDPSDLLAGVHLVPMAKLHDIQVVQILTRVSGG